MTNGKCYRHGGPTPIGPASASWRHGRYSQMLAGLRGLRGHYLRAERDPDLQDLHGELALNQARTCELLEVAAKAGSIDGLWPQLAELLEQKRKLVHTASGILRDRHESLSIERMMVMIGYVTDTVKRHVTDRAALAAICADVEKLLRPVG